MSLHAASVHWNRKPHEGEAETYSRNHLITLNGGQKVNGSASKGYKGDPSCTDPEQMLVSALAMCHMLTFLAIAELQGFNVERYEDSPVGHLDKFEDGALGITRIDLNPTVQFSGAKMPDASAISRLHASAHRNCFIRNSLKTKVNIL